MKSKVKEKDESLLIIVLLGLGLFVPAFLGQLTFLGENRQLIVGTIVNATLFTCALKINDPKKIIALSVLPSLSSMATGLLFTGLTLYSKVMLPFIWAGNLSLILCVKYFTKNYKFISSSIVAIIIKVGIIYGGFKLMSSLIKFPPKVSTVFGTTFGINQIYTAVMGLILVLTIIGAKKVNQEKEF